MPGSFRSKQTRTSPKRAGTSGRLERWPGPPPRPRGGRLPKQTRLAGVTCGELDGVQAPWQVAIVGGSAAGKGTLACALARALPGRVARVELDAFYRDLSALPPARRAGWNFDHPRAMDWAAVQVVFDQLAAGRSAWLPVYDFARHVRLPAWRQVQPAPMILWDGLWLLDWSWMRRRFDFSIFVACDPATCLARRLARDVRERGRTPDSVRRQYWTQVLPLQRRWVEPQRWVADVVLRSPWSGGEFAALAERLAARGAALSPAAPPAHAS